MNPSRLEEYLDQVEATLARLTAGERREWREEARQHLLARAEAHVELGADEEEALGSAIRQFGEPESLGRALAAATTRGTLRGVTDSHRLGYATWALIWNISVLMAAIRVLMTRAEAGGSDWTFALGPWQIAGAGLLIGAGYVASGAALGWSTGEKRLPAQLVLSYLGLIASGLLLTGTFSIFTPAVALAAGSVIGGSLIAGSLAARTAGERRTGQSALPDRATPD